MQVRHTHVHNLELFDVRFVRSGWGDALEGFRGGVDGVGNQVA